MSLIISKVIPQDVVNQYNSYMADAESAYGAVGSGLGRYWWALYKIYSEKLWVAGFESLDDWLGDLSRQSWGPSRASFFSRMKAIKTWFDLGLSEEEVRTLLGNPKVAIEYDVRRWFAPGGSEILPEVRARIEAEGKTPAQVIIEAGELGPSEARKRIRAFLDRDEIYPVGECDMSDDELRMRFVYETAKSGVVGDYEIVVVFPKGTPVAVRDHIVRRLFGRAAFL